MAKVTFRDLLDGRIVLIEKVPSLEEFARSISVKTKSGSTVELKVEWHGNQRDGESVIAINDYGGKNEQILVSNDH